MSPVRTLSRARSVVGVLLLSAAAALPSGGCKKKYPTVEEMNEENRKAMAPVLAKHKEASTAQVEALKAIGADAQAAAPVTAREPAAVALVPLPASDEPESAGLLVASVEWLAAAGGSNQAKVPVTPKLALHDLARLMADGYLSSSSPDWMDSRFDQLEKVKQVAAVRVREYAPPKVVFAAGSRRFEGARASGDVIVYEAATRKRVAAFPFEARQRDEVSVRAKDDAGATKELEQAFVYDVERAAKKEYAAFAAGAAGPSAPGSADEAERKRFADKIKSKLLTDVFLSGPEKVEVSAGTGGRPLVTIWSSNLPQVGRPDGTARPEVVAVVTQVLGVEADVKVLKAPEK